MSPVWSFFPPWEEVSLLILFLVTKIYKIYQKLKDAKNYQLLASFGRKKWNYLLVIVSYGQKKRDIALLWSGCTHPKNCSSLKNHFSEPNYRTDMKIFVYDPNTSKNIWEFFESFFIIKNWQKKYKNLVSVVWY